MSCGQHYKFCGFFRELYISKEFLFVIKKAGKELCNEGVLLPLLYIFTASYVSQREIFIGIQKSKTPELETMQLNLIMRNLHF